MMQSSKMRVKTFVMRLHYIAASIVKLSELPRICFYCGEPASDREHVYPKSVFGERGFKVWSCGECNTIASNKVFETIDDKGEYIRRGLAKKYKKLYSFPDWDEDELSEISGSLRKKIIAWMEAKSWIRKRLNWHTNVVVMRATKYLQSEDIGKDSVEKVAEKNGMRHCALTSLIELD
jgi:Zn-finger protein